jgi:tRNA nucleotidyltransferase (CCA-adding enzyme)
MELIVAHENTDFDAFAACVAAQKLHPAATIGFGRRLARPVRDFWSLHKDRFVAHRVHKLDLSEVHRLIVVDVRDRRRLKYVQPVLDRLDDGGAVDVHVYDHHPASPHDLTGSVQVVEPVGAVTTLLVERMRTRGISVDPMEATLFALGIYTDTAALTLGNTTPRDARAVAWLLEQGASLSMVNRYLVQPFSSAQRGVLADILSGVRVEDLNGLPVGLAVVRRDAHVEGLAEVTTEACRLEQQAALFTLCAVGDKKVEVVGRGRTPLVDVGATLRALGGGGHRGAGSAVVKKGDPEALAEKILATLRAAPPEPRVVGDVMSSPVRCVGPDVPLGELGRLLDTWGHSGVPVVRDGHLLGVVSRRDIDRAAANGRAGLPVSSHMSGEVRTAEPDLPLEEALERMVKDDIGRLPVLREGKLIGIVSRTDLLRALYPRTG